MNLPPLRYIFLTTVVILLILVAVITLLQGRASFSANIDSFQLEVHDKTYNVQKNQTIILAPGKYPYRATQTGYRDLEGEVVIRGGNTQKVSLNFTQLDSLERDLPLFQQRYPGYRVVERYNGPDDVIVARLEKTGASANRKLILTTLSGGQRSVTVEGIDYFTPTQVSGLPINVKDWLINENFIAESTFDKEVD